ncbi:hypothetical protein [Paraglaciecola sp. 2405UD69-4]|uniref:hypothetical protein n=1 Tax=Paraglaciecola sp. 2405UD69-4 TaxID=3391836 RepID=UPI0039C9E822
MPSRLSRISYTESVVELNRQIHSVSKQATSLYQQAASYFAGVDKYKTLVSELETRLEQKQRQLLTVSAIDKARLIESISVIQQRLDNIKSEFESKRLLRLDSAISVCSKILEMTESHNFEGTQLKSAKFLGTILLLSPGRGKKLSELHQRFKPAYKAVLSIRLLDKLIKDGNLRHSYTLKHYDVNTRYEKQSSFSSPYSQSVVLPIMLTALFQDIGFQHPDVIAIMKGDGSLDEFRPLQPEERNLMLKLGYKYAIDYLQNGLGLQEYTGNSKLEKERFTVLEKSRVKFQLELLKDALSSKIGIGDIIKIPQVYTSVVLSTKRNFIKKDLPKAAKIISQLALNSSVNLKAAEAFISIVGHFPQGYGVTLIPKNLQGVELNNYEYGIVTRLNPSNPDEPICKIVTRNLTYITSGATTSIKKDCNLHFNVARNKLSKVDAARLRNIMQTLSYSFKADDVDNLIPSLWEPYEYFSDVKNQSLWKK